MIWTFFSLFLYTFLFFILVTIINQSDSVIGCGFSVHRVGVCIEKIPIHIHFNAVCIHNATTTEKCIEAILCVQREKQNKRRMCMQCAHVSTQTLKNQRFFLSFLLLCSCVGQNIFFPCTCHFPDFL